MSGAGRDRDKGRTHPSGYQKRQKNRMTEQMIKKLPKIMTFATARSSASSSGSGSSVPPNMTKTVVALDQSEESLNEEEPPVQPQEEEMDLVMTATASDANLETEETLNEEEPPVQTQDEMDLVTTMAASDANSETADTSLVALTATHDDEKVEASEELEEYPSDIGLWPANLTESFHEHWLQKGSKPCQNAKSDFKNSAVKETQRGGNRHCTAALFKHKHSLTDEILDVTWLCYSESQGKVFCFPCKLLSNEVSVFITGFQDWKHAGEAIESHGKSTQHQRSLADVIMRSKTNARIDQQLIESQQAESNYWRAVLTRVIDVLVFLSGRGG